MLLLLLLSVVLLIPFNIKVINVFDNNSFKISFLIFNLSVDQETLKKRFKENKPTIKQIINYFSLSNFIADLLRICHIKCLKITKYIEDNNFYQTYPIISYYLLTSFIDGWLKSNHKNYRFEKVMVGNQIRTDYDFYLLIKISLIQIIYCAVKNLKDIARFMKKERLINGS